MSGKPVILTRCKESIGLKSRKREIRLETVSSMYCEGRTYQEMASRVGVTTTQIDRDVALIIGRWQAQSKDDVERMIGREFGKYNHVEAELWQCYHRTFKRSSSVVTKGLVSSGEMDDDDGSAQGKSVVVPVEQIVRSQDALETERARILAEIRKTIDCRVHLLSLVTRKVELSNKPGETFKVQWPEDLQK